MGDIMSNNKFVKENFDNYRTYTNQLSKEYLTIFKKIEAYINSSSKISPLEKNNIFLQIIDTFLSAQSDSKSVYDIIGINLKKYCDNMIYGESIYIFKVSRICSNIIGSLFYISFMHFFISIMEAIRLKNTGIIFKPMNFGIGEIILIIGYICIPKIMDIMNRNYFENTIRCKKVKKYTYYGVWIFTIAIYTEMKDIFNGYGINISFSSIVLILVYISIISIAVYLLIKIFNDGKLKINDEEKRDKYYEILNKEYEKHKSKCMKYGKQVFPLNKFKKRKVKTNCIFTIIFSIYGIIFLGFEIIIGRSMLINGNISALGIIILIGITFINIVIAGVIREGIYRVKQLK